MKYVQFITDNIMEAKTGELKLVFGCPWGRINVLRRAVENEVNFKVEMWDDRCSGYNYAFTKGYGETISTAMDFVLDLERIESPDVPTSIKEHIKILLIKRWGEIKESVTEHKIEEEIFDEDGVVVAIRGLEDSYLGRVTNLRYAITLIVNGEVLGYDYCEKEMELITKSTGLVFKGLTKVCL